MTFVERKPQMVEAPGTAKPWLRWDGDNAVISDLDTYILHHRCQMKPCTFFDKLDMDNGENQAFGTLDLDQPHSEADYLGEVLAWIENTCVSVEKEL